MLSNEPSEVNRRQVLKALCTFPFVPALPAVCETYSVLSKENVQESDEFIVKRLMQYVTNEARKALNTDCGAKNVYATWLQIGNCPTIVDAMKMAGLLQNGEALTEATWQRIFMQKNAVGKMVEEAQGAMHRICTHDVLEESDLMHQIVADSY